MSIIFHIFFTENISEKLRIFSPLFCFVFTANNSTEGGAKKIPIWEVVKELPIAQRILNGFP
jgi:hypothetical protein